MELARILAYVTGTVDQELLARNEYLAAENCILKALSLFNIRFDLGIRLAAKIARADCLSAASKIGYSCNALHMGADRRCSRATQLEKGSRIHLEACVLDRSLEFTQHVVHSDDANH